MTPEFCRKNNMTPLTSIDPPEYIKRDPMFLQVWNEVAPVWLKNGWVYRCTLGQLEAVVGLRLSARIYRSCPKYVDVVGGGVVDVNEKTANMLEGQAQRYEDNCCSQVN